MPNNKVFSFKKNERLYLKKQIDALFGGGKTRALTAYPIRLIYKPVARLPHEAKAQILISVPKRHLKHAVDRNRVKRQLREAYRLNKQLLVSLLNKENEEGVDMAFVWLDNKLYSSEVVHKHVINLLTRLNEKL